jgi:hypothetical protein
MDNKTRRTLMVIAIGIGLMTLPQLAATDYKTCDDKLDACIASCHDATTCQKTCQTTYKSCAGPDGKQQPATPRR